MKPESHFSIYFRPVTRTKVIKIIDKPKNKSAGIECIKADTLQTVAAFSDDPLVKLINSSCKSQ